MVGELELALDCSGEAGQSGTENGVFNDGPVPVPWETSFEDGFCGYKADAGFCYGSDYRIVTEPARTPPFAAAFEIGVAGEGRRPSMQTRCAREGELPQEAFYGAWFYLPAPATDIENWNLMHFRTGQPGGPILGQWDVSIEEHPGVGLAAYVFEFDDAFDGTVHQQVTPVPIPIGRWFHLELYLKRTGDASGAVALYQDGSEVLSLEQVVTDDAPFGQWYVGNLAARLTPSNYTLYVDDVTIRLSR